VITNFHVDVDIGRNVSKLSQDLFLVPKGQNASNEDFHLDWQIVSFVKFSDVSFFDSLQWLTRTNTITVSARIDNGCARPYLGLSAIWITSLAMTTGELK
jgi:hypothetical protein